MCEYALLIIKYRNGCSSDDKPIMCKDETELSARLKDVQSRPEATQIDVFIHNQHASIQLVQEWRARAAISKTETPSNRPADVLPPAPPVAPVDDP